MMSITCGSRCVCEEYQASGVGRETERQRECSAIVWAARACIHGHGRGGHGATSATRYTVGEWTPVSIGIARQVQTATHIHEATRAHECRKRAAQHDRCIIRRLNQLCLTRTLDTSRCLEKVRQCTERAPPSSCTNQQRVAVVAAKSTGSHSDNVAVLTTCHCCTKEQDRSRGRL